MSHTQYLTVTTMFPVVQIDLHVVSDEMIQREIACAPLPSVFLPFPK